MQEDTLIEPVSADIARLYIHKHAPRLTIHSLHYMGGGSSSTYAVNHEQVFRFPKIAPEEAGAAFQREQRLLEYIRPAVLPHLLPELLAHLPADESLFPYPVWVYTYLSGTQAAKLPPAQRPPTARMLGDFLSKFHRLDMEAPGMETITAGDIRQGWFTSYKRLRDWTVSPLEAAEHRWLMGVYETLLADAGSMQPPVTWTHGDFGPENVLSADNHLHIIDFEDCGPGDPVVDFCLWWGEWGEDFLDDMLKAYTGPVDPHFRQRLRFYFDRIPLFYFEYGARTNNLNFIRFGRSLLDQRMNRKA